MGCVLFSRPSHDNTIIYLHYYSKELVELSKKNHHKTLNRENEKANKGEIVNLIQKQKPAFIMFNGHGNPDTICGHNNEPLVTCDENHNILFDSIVYSLSCSSCLNLGKKAGEGGSCFVGYEMDFALGKDPDSQAAPLKDKVAKLFLEPSNILVKSLLNGFSAEASIRKAKEKMKENIGYLNTTKDFPEAIHYVPYLLNNYMGLNAHGDETKSF